MLKFDDGFWILGEYLDSFHEATDIPKGLLIPFETFNALICSATIFWVNTRYEYIEF